MLDNFSFILEGKLAGCANPAAAGRVRDALQEMQETHGIRAVVSLTEKAAPESLFEENSMAFLHEPIRDFSPPTLAQMQRIAVFVAEQIAEKRPVAVHCTAGQGRTGTVLACLLLSLTDITDPARAIGNVRRLRPGSIETPEQEAFVQEWSRQEW